MGFAGDGFGRSLLYRRKKLNGTFRQKSSDGREVVFEYKNNFKNGPHAIYYSPNEKGEKITAVQATFEDDICKA